MFLGHKLYDDLEKLIGAEATVKLAEKLGGDVHYFPTVRKDGEAPVRFDGLDVAEIRTMVLNLRRQGKSGTDIVKIIKNTYPSEPKKWVSSSGIYRFFERVRQGKMRHLGIDDMFREIGE
ncbi:MAG: hypothetical protein M0024_01515 [Nitrospiraceae bacterium]|nr:hypothetical protein [Nitrospiraceae bacterium]